MIDVRCLDHRHVVDAATGGITERHLGRFAHALLESPHVWRGMAGQGDFHQHLLTFEHRVPVDLRTVALDQAEGFKFTHPLPGRGYRKIDRLGQARLGDTPVVSEDSQDFQVIAIEFVHGPMIS
ncbi:hypothetical protein D3C87_1658370 [compost metagenome]